MNPETLTTINTIIGTVNLTALLIIAFHGGRWMGKVDVRLDHLEKRET